MYTGASLPKVENKLEFLRSAWPLSHKADSFRLRAALRDYNKRPPLVAVLSHVYLNKSLVRQAKANPRRGGTTRLLKRGRFDQQWRKKVLPLTAEAEAGSYPATGLAKVKPFFN